MKKLYELLYSHSVARMPKEMQQRKNLILTVTIVSTLIFDILSFSIKGAQAALTANMNGLALFLMVLYFLREVLKSSIRAFTDDQKNQFGGQSDTYITANICNISNAVRGKVFRKKEEYSLIMPHPEIIFNLKDFIGYVWVFWQDSPVVIANSIMAFVMALYLHYFVRDSL